MTAHFMIMNWHSIDVMERLINIILNGQDLITFSKKSIYAVWLYMHEMPYISYLPYILFCCMYKKKK